MGHQHLKKELKLNHSFLREPLYNIISSIFKPSERGSCTQMRLYVVLFPEQIVYFHCKAKIGPLYSFQSSSLNSTFVSTKKGLYDERKRIMLLALSDIGGYSE